jgi:HAD superfamily phosphoserine phosphatase-like hydrolase
MHAAPTMLRMPIRLAAFDLDGTLIRDRTCIEAVVESIGRTNEAAAFESLDVRDLDGMAAARNSIAGWLRPFPTDVLLRDVRDLALAPGVEEAFSMLRRHHVTTAILSLTWKPAVDWFAERLRADFAVGTSHEDDGIDHVWPEDKGRWLLDFAAQHGLDQRELAAVGDSDGDREMLAAAGFRVCVGDRPLKLPDVVHMPGADMLEVAERIVERT